VKLLRTHPAIAIELTKVTEERWEEGERYFICTVCGRLPAVFETPWKEKEYEESIPQRLRLYIDRGEKLCSYCLVKRLISNPNVLPKIVKGLIGISNGESSISFPSTGDIAAIEFKRRFVDALEKAEADERRRLLERVRF